MYGISGAESRTTSILNDFAPQAATPIRGMHVVLCAGLPTPHSSATAGLFRFTPPKKKKRRPTVGVLCGVGRPAHHGVIDGGLRRLPVLAAFDGTFPIGVQAGSFGGCRGGLEFGITGPIAAEVVETIPIADC